MSSQLPMALSGQTGSGAVIEVRCRAEGDAVVLELAGDVCLVTMPTIVSCIDAALDTGTAHVVVDLADVTLFGSSAANLIIETSRRVASTGGALTLRNASGVTSYVIELAGLAALLDRSELRAVS